MENVSELNLCLLVDYLN